MNLESFSPLLGERFEVLPEDSSSVITSIVLAKAERHSKASSESGRPFSLEFTGEAGDVELAQGSYWLRNPQLELDLIFLVPIGPRRYDATFN